MAFALMFMVPFQISVTTTALAKIQETLQNHLPVALGVRVFVYKTPAGVQHGLNIAEEITPTDHVFEIGDVVFVADAQSALFLNNMTLDYVSSEWGDGFVFQSGCSGKSCLQCRGACRGRAVDEVNAPL